MGTRKKTPRLFTPATIRRLDRKEKQINPGRFTEVRDISQLSRLDEVEAVILRELRARRWLKFGTLLDRVEKQFELVIVKSVVTRLLATSKIVTTPTRKLKIA